MLFFFFFCFWSRPHEVDSTMTQKLIMIPEDIDLTMYPSIDNEAVCSVCIMAGGIYLTMQPPLELNRVLANFLH